LPLLKLDQHVSLAAIEQHQIVTGPDRLLSLPCGELVEADRGDLEAVAPPVRVQDPPEDVDHLRLADERLVAFVHGEDQVADPARLADRQMARPVANLLDLV
jgi:hypothetical protein